MFGIYKMTNEVTIDLEELYILLTYSEQLDFDEPMKDKMRRCH